MEPFKWDKNFSELVLLVLNSEGGYVNDPDDPGGPTKYGIATNYNKNILARLGVKDIRDLTLDQAKEIYFQKYWVASNAHQIPDKRLAYLHFDTAVNCGVGQAAVFLSRLSKSPKNFEAGGKNDELWLRLFLEYVQHRQHYYTHCKGRQKYLEGWINRMNFIIHRVLQFS